MIQQFSADQIETLRNEYSTIASVHPDRLTDFRSIFAKCANAALDQLSVAGIRFVSALARNERRRRLSAVKE